MNDTFRQANYESNESRLYISDESDVEIANRSFGEDYRGDLKSHRVMNQSESDKTEREEDTEKFGRALFTVINPGVLTTKKGDERAL